MTEYVKFEDWLKEQVIDAEYLLPEAKKAFRENYEKLKAEGNLPKAKRAEKIQNMSWKSSRIRTAA